MLLLALLLAGCGGGPAATPEVDVDQARRVLRATLESWRAGEAHDAPARLSPPVRVADEDWRAGAHLASFEIRRGDEVVGPQLRCPVTLRIRDRAGRTASKLVSYNVTTAPTPSVIRED